MTATVKRRRATTDGKCACCMMPYRAGVRLRLEHERYWVLDVHVLPPRESKSKRGRS